MSDNDNKSFSVDKQPAQFQLHHKAAVALARKQNNPASKCKGHWSVENMGTLETS